MAQADGVTPTTPSAAAAIATPVTSDQAAPGAQAAVAQAAVAGAAPAAATALAGPDTPAGAKPGSNNYVPPAPPTGNFARARFAATQEWLKSAPGDRYSIQLLTAGTHDVRRIEELLARTAGRNLNLSDFYVYGVKIDDEQHYRLAYGLYPTLAEVTQGIKDLPPVYLQFGPYYRSVGRMRSQNHQ